MVVQTRGVLEEVAVKDDDAQGYSDVIVLHVTILAVTSSRTFLIYSFTMQGWCSCCERFTVISGVERIATLSAIQGWRSVDPPLQRETISSNRPVAKPRNSNI